MDFSVIIKNIRSTLALSQDDLAKRLNVTKTTVCRWERGIHEPHLSFKQFGQLLSLLKSCKEMGKTIDIF